MSSPLIPCITIVNDKFHLCVSAYPVRQVSVMHQQGSPFPPSVEQEYDDPEKAMAGLESLTRYYSTRDSDKTLTKKQEKLQEKIEKSPFKIVGKKQKKKIKEEEEEYIP